MVRFWARKGIKKDVFSSCLGRGTKKKSEPSRGIEPQTFGFRVPMFYNLATETLYDYRLLYYIKVHVSNTSPAYCFYQGNKGQQIV